MCPKKPKPNPMKIIAPASMYTAIRKALEDLSDIALAHNIATGGTLIRMYPGSFDPENEKKTTGTIANHRRTLSFRSKILRRPGMIMNVHGNVSIIRAGT